ncbi:MAG: type I restriction enzyme HsdR N-terminal domain-containing protein [Simkaniaceae bacterium]
MALSPPSKQVYDRIRKKWVEATPEELVRQKLLTFMIEKLGYPKHSLSVEKKLSEVADGYRLPNRRLDILCFETQTLRPLLLIECKAVPIHKKMLAQVMGYNAYIGAPFICLANQDSIFLGWRDQDRIQEGLPTYSELVNACI